MELSPQNLKDIKNLLQGKILFTPGIPQILYPLKAD